MELPWHPPLLAAALVLGQYLGQITSVMAVWRPLLVIVAVAVLLTVVAGLITRGIQRGALAASASLLLFRSGGLGQAVVAFVVVAAVLAAIGLTLRWRQIRHPAAMMTRVLNLFAVLLLAVLAVNLVAAGRVPEIVADWRQGTSIDEFEAMSAEEGLVDPSRPDVYLIQLDGYPRQDTLNRLFDFDNSGFIAELEKRGLAVAGDSHSNYMYTELTMASLLQMKLVADIPGISEERDLRLKVNHNPVFDTFREREYVVASTASGWETAAMRSADVFCGGEAMSDFELNFFGPTVLGRLVELAVPRLVADRDRASVNTALDCVSRVAAVRLDRPRFLYAHVPAPHLPIVFDADGNPAVPELYGHTAQELPVTAEQFQRGYTAGLQYLNGRVLTAIDDIRAHSLVPPIIIVFSDHGSESHLNWGNALLSDMDERFSNFFAASTPGAPGLFGDRPTPVNMFPVLFDHYFGTDIAFQPDDRFASTVQNRLDLRPAPPLAYP